MFSEEARCKIITIMHAIWTSRNNWTHGKEGYNPTQALKWIHETLSILDLPGRRPQVSAGQGWRPPDAGWITINTDGSVFPDTSTGGAGGVARSHLAFLGAWCKPLPGTTDPFIAELLAFREGVIFAQLRGMSHVIIEVDNSELVTQWNSRRTSRSIAAPILQQLEDIALNFVSFSVRHVSREFNSPAHQCAQRACTLEWSECWLDQSPDFLVNGLRADCNRMILR